ncbi:MAG TPA: hypothetical protein VIT19_08710 [Pyrinomonadaceae bacterium]
MPQSPRKNDDTSYLVTYKAALEDLAEMMAEREELDAKRDDIDKRIIRLRDAITGLGGLCNMNAESIAKEHPELFPDRVTPDVGFTDAIRMVFKKNPDYFHSPVWIRDALEEDGFDVDKYKNVLASIHSIVKRLKIKGDVMEANREGKAVYKLNPKGELAKTIIVSDDDVPF